MKQETVDRLAALRTKGHKEIYFVEIGGRDILFRPLTFNEYELVTELEQHTGGPEINDMLVRFVVLNDADAFMSTCKAGDVDKLAQAAIDMSAFRDPNVFIEKVEKFRREAESLETVITTYICSVFHTIAPNDVRNMTMEQQLELFAQAEQALGVPVNFREFFEPKRRPRQRQMPEVPPGYETTDPEEILSRDLADSPQFQ